MHRVIAYVDETGDRGSSAGSSPIFGMAAVLVPERAERPLQGAVDQLRNDFKVPVEAVMSWKSHLKNHDRRRRAVEVLTAVDGISVCYVYAAKTAIQNGSYHQNREVFYNYVAHKIFKSIVWAAKYEHQATELHIRFGHVRHHDNSTTKSYIEREAYKDQRIPKGLVKSMRWVSADQYRESQAADLFGGFLRAAAWPSGDFGYVEPSYLLGVWPLLRKSRGCAIPLGIMSLPDYSILTSEPWFPCADCPKKEKGTSTGRSIAGGR